MIYVNWYIEYAIKSSRQLIIIRYFTHILILPWRRPENYLVFSDFLRFS